MFLNSNYAISLNNYFYFIKINIKENNYVSYRPIKSIFFGLGKLLRSWKERKIKRII